MNSYPFPACCINLKRKRKLEKPNRVYRHNVHRLKTSFHNRTRNFKLKPFKQPAGRLECMRLSNPHSPMTMKHSGAWKWNFHVADSINVNLKLTARRLSIRFHPRDEQNFTELIYVNFFFRCVINFRIKEKLIKNVSSFRWNREKRNKNCYSWK